MHADKQQAGGLPAVDGKFEEVVVDEYVTVVHAEFKEVIDNVNSMTVIKYGDYVIFWNPVSAPAELYKRLQGDKKIVVCFIVNMYHHMAAQICIQTCGGSDVVMVWGCNSAAPRHPVPLVIKEPGPLPGITFFHLPSNAYDEWWMYFEPSQVLCVGDFTPNIEFGNMGRLALSIAHCPRCGDKCTAMGYARSLVMDHRGMAKMIKEIAELPFTRLEGAHSVTSSLCPSLLEHRGDGKDAFLDYWRWLVPRPTTNTNVVEPF